MESDGGERVWKKFAAQPMLERSNTDRHVCIEYCVCVRTHSVNFNTHYSHQHRSHRPTSSTRTLTTTTTKWNYISSNSFFPLFLFFGVVVFCSRFECYSIRFDANGGVLVQAVAVTADATRPRALYTFIVFHVFNELLNMFV